MSHFNDLRFLYLGVGSIGIRSENDLKDQQYQLGYGRYWKNDQVQPNSCTSSGIFIPHTFTRGCTKKGKDQRT